MSLKPAWCQDKLHRFTEKPCLKTKQNKMVHIDSYIWMLSYQGVVVLGSMALFKNVSLRMGFEVWDAQTTSSVSPLSLLLLAHIDVELLAPSLAECLSVWPHAFLHDWCEILLCVLWLPLMKKETHWPVDRAELREVGRTGLYSSKEEYTKMALKFLISMPQT